VVSIGVATWIFYKLVRLISNSNYSLWFVVLFLLNPYTVWAGTQIRLYAFLLLLATLSVYLFFSFFNTEKNKFLIAFSVVGIIGINTQYLYVFLLLSLGVSILIYKSWKFFLKFCLYMLPAAIFFLYDILFTTSPIKLAYVASIQQSFLSKVFAVFHSPQNLMLSLDILPFGRIVRFAVIGVFVLVLGTGYVKFYKIKKHTDKLYFYKINSILIAVTLLVICIALLFAKTGIDYTDRYLTVGLPLMVSLWLLVSMHTKMQRNIIFSFFAVYYILILSFNYKHPVNDFDSRALAAYITKIEKPDEPVLFYPKVIALPVKYYYNGKNVIVPLPDSIRLDSTYLTKIKDTVELDQAIKKASSTAQSYLLITNRFEPQFANDADVKMVNNYLPIHYNITLDTFVYGKFNPLRIRRLQKK
jgi:hypothetical protein